MIEAGTLQAHPGHAGDPSLLGPYFPASPQPLLLLQMLLWARALVVSGVPNVSAHLSVCACEFISVCV